jgi:dolichol-phosphate mannosyltransferase
MKTIVVIPTYNEIENIPNLIQKIHSYLPEIDILIVDDNSPDGTAQFIEKLKAENPKIHLIVRQKKMGLGTAYCTGFQYALDNGFDIIMQMDADFSHDPKDLPVFLKEIQNYDLIIGSRYIHGINVVNWPLSRLFLSKGANVYTRLITRMPIQDATGGFKCFRADFLRYIDLKHIRSNGYSFQIEMNYRMWRLGARIKELDIIFNDRRSGSSKMNKKIIYEAMWKVWILRFSLKLNKELNSIKKLIKNNSSAK